MAITYDVKVSEIRGNDGTYSVKATITDDAKPIDNQIEVVTITSARMDNEKQKTELWDNIHNHYLAAVAKTDSILSLEAEAKAYLETK